MTDPIIDTPASQHLTAEQIQSRPQSPGLYIVSTPIGNLRDITLRALDVLNSADLILAEDTRQSRKLLSAYNIDTQMRPYHDHNTTKEIPKIMDLLASGKTLALISDAGTPLISDPGFKLVREANRQGHAVFPIPGASSLLAGLVKSGLPSDRFLFEGFLPAKQSGRCRALESLANIPATLIFFETGKRIEKTLIDMAKILGEREVALTRELTKTYEEGRFGTFHTLIESVKADPPRGEIVLIVGPPTEGAIWSEAMVIKGLQDLIPQVGMKKASAELSGSSGWSQRDLYQKALSLKSKPLE